MALTDAQRAAARQALNDWATPQIAAASVFERGAIKSYLEAHGDALVDVIGTAVVSVSEGEQS